jgi:NADPH:quinone reductase-like Zn-dependent oxidoreductase
MLASQVKTDKCIKINAITYENYATPLSMQTLYIPYEGESMVKPTEVLVQVKANSVNPVDCIFKNFSNNWFGPKVKIFGGDFAGVVVEAGSETNYKPGDKIYGDALDMKRRGAFSDTILIEPSACLICEKMPEGMSFDEAASLPCVSNTAFEGLQKYKGDLKGKNVLVLGAGTSVGFFSVQFANYYFGAANVVATCSSKSSEKTMKAGADLTVDYHKGEESKLNALHEFVKANGLFDIIIDCVRDEFVMDNFPTLLKTESENGVFAQVSGSYSLDYQNIRLYQLLPSLKKLKARLSHRFGFSKYPVVPIWTSKDPEYGQAVEKLWKDEKLYIVIDSVMDAYTQFQEAFDRVASCKAQGKVVINWEQPPTQN